MNRSVAGFAAAGLLTLSSAFASQPGIDAGLLDTMRVPTPQGVFVVPYAAEQDLFRGLQYAIGRDRAMRLPLSFYVHAQESFPEELGALLAHADRLDGRNGYVTIEALDRVIAEESAAAARGEVATSVLEK